MIIERIKFHLKFGKAKESISLWKQMIEELKKDERFQFPVRILTDVTSSSYTLIIEMNLRSYTDINPLNYLWSVHAKVRELYQQFIPLCESAERQLYKIEMEVGPAKR